MEFYVTNNSKTKRFMRMDAVKDHHLFSVCTLNLLLLFNLLSVLGSAVP